MKKIYFTLILSLFFIACGDDKKEVTPEFNVVKKPKPTTKPADDFRFNGEDYCSSEDVIKIDVGANRLCVKEPSRMRFGPGHTNTIEFTVVNKSSMEKIKLEQLSIQPWMKHCCGVRPAQSNLTFIEDSRVHKVEGLYFSKPSHHKWVVVISFVDGTSIFDFEVEIPFVDR